MKHRETESKKTWKRICRYDLKVGMWQVRYRWLFGILLLFFLGILVWQGVEQAEGKNFWDLVWYMFSGSEPYEQTDTSVFRLPVMLILHQMILFFIVGSYAKTDMAGYGRHVLLTARSRWNWWWAKCTWIFLQTFLYYIATYIIVCLVAITGGKAGFGISSSYRFGETKGEQVIFLINLIVLPLLTSMMFATVQLIIGFLTKPVLGYGCVLGTLVLSSYFASPWVLGNYLMMLRNRYMVGEGMEWKTGIFLDIFVIVILVVFGGEWMRRKDILTGGEE